MDALSIYNPAYGALHYFATVYLAYTDVFDKEPQFDFTLVSPDDPTANTVFTDANGAVYTEQKDGFRHMCLSDACVDAWLDKINTEPISDVRVCVCLCACVPVCLCACVSVSLVSSPATGVFVYAAAPRRRVPI